MRIWSNAKNVAKRLGRLARSLGPVTRKALDIWARETAAEVKRAAPRRTGTLRRSIRGRTTVVGGHPRATINAGVPQAIWQEFGTKRHTIVPRSRRFLRWVTNGGWSPVSGKSNRGGYRFAKSVTIPKQPPRPFFFQTIRARYKYLPLDLRARLLAEAKRG